MCITFRTPCVSCFIIPPRETCRRTPSARPGNRPTASATTTTAATSGSPAPTHSPLPTSTPDTPHNPRSAPPEGPMNRRRPSTRQPQERRPTIQSRARPGPAHHPTPTPARAMPRGTKHERRSPPRCEAAGASRPRQARPKRVGPRQRDLDRRELRSEEHAPDQRDRRHKTRDHRPVHEDERADEPGPTSEPASTKHHQHPPKPTTAVPINDNDNPQKGSRREQLVSRGATGDPRITGEPSEHIRLDATDAPATKRNRVKSKPYPNSPWSRSTIPSFTSSQGPTYQTADERQIPSERANGPDDIRAPKTPTTTGTSGSNSIAEIHDSRLATRSIRSGTRRIDRPQTAETRSQLERERITARRPNSFIDPFRSRSTRSITAKPDHQLAVARPRSRLRTSSLPEPPFPNSAGKSCSSADATTSSDRSDETPKTAAWAVAITRT